MLSSPSRLAEPRTYLWQFDPARYKRAYLFGQVDEKTVQETIRQTLPMLGVDCDWVDAGGAAMRGKMWSALMRAFMGMGLGRVKAEAMAKKVLSDVSGVSAADKGRSDLSGDVGGGRSWYIEVKAPAWLNPKTGGTIRPAGVPSPEQLSFLDRKHRIGCLVGVAWSVDDALEILAPALGSRRPSLT